MPNTEIRQLHGEEMLETLYGLTSYAFHPSPPLTNKDEWKEWVETRLNATCLVLYEDNQPAACAVSSPMVQNIRGTLYGMGGIWGVVTTPTARRKGYSRQLIASLLSASRNSGLTFSCLYPFRESFYENLGYTTFPAPQLARFTTQALASLLKKDLGGQVEWRQVRDGFDDYQYFLNQQLNHLHGMAVYNPADTIKALQNSLWQLQVNINGRIEGMMLYEIQDNNPDQGRFQFCAVCFHYNTSQAKYLLLQWIARHVDQVEKVLILLPPGEQPGTWLADLQVKTEAYHAPMGRLIDLSGMNGMHTGPGCFTAHIEDALCPWNTGTWRFETIDGQLRVSRSESAECQLTIHAISALVYGTHDIGDFSWRNWGSPTPKIQAAMQNMFPSKFPFLNEIF